MIYSKDHAIGKNAEAPADVVEELERIETNNEAQGENLNVENVGDDVDDNVSFSLASRKRPKTSNSSSRRMRRNKDSKELGELKELTTLIVAQMKDSSNVVTRAMGQEINEKQVGLSEEFKKINNLTTVERLKATTQIARDSAVLNVFYSLWDEDRETWVKLFLDGEI